MKGTHQDNLKAVADLTKKAALQLKTSYDRCSKIGLEGPHDEEALIEFEALTGRYARLIDILVHKLYRAIDFVELIDGGTLIDTINRAEKRGIISSSLEVRSMKDLRNEIAHEYLQEKLTALHKEVYESVPQLLEMANSGVGYCRRYLNP